MIIPFFIPHAGCPHQCVFCNQKNITGEHSAMDASSIPARIQDYLDRDGSGEPAQIAFYGGSFTALPLETQKRYLEAALPFVQSGRIAGIRLSTRPDAITDDSLKLLKQYRVQTVELGVQSMDDGVLTRAGRGHTAADIEHAATLLSGYGFSIGLQLMPGLPGDTPAIFRDTVEKTISLRPAFVRLYPALVIKDTPLEALYRTDRYRPLTLDEAVLLCRDALLRFEKAGIKVIRIGLQPTEELAKRGTIVAGPYHPAFRQLVESAILLDRMTARLIAGKPASRDVVFRVHPGDLSAAVGQKRSNRETLKKQFGLINVRFQPDESMARRAVEIATG